MKKVTKSKSNTTSPQHDMPSNSDRQSVYLVTVNILVPHIKEKDGKEYKQSGVSFALVLTNYPTVESLTIAFDNHPVIRTEPRLNMIRALFLDGLAIWGIPNLLDFGGIETHSVHVDWSLTGTQKDKPLLDFNPGSLTLSRKVIE